MQQHSHFSSSPSLLPYASTKPRKQPRSAAAFNRAPARFAAVPGQCHLVSSRPPKARAEAGQRERARRLTVGCARGPPPSRRARDRPSRSDRRDLSQEEVGRLLVQRTAHRMMRRRRSPSQSARGAQVIGPPLHGAVGTRSASRSNARACIRSTHGAKLRATRGASSHLLISGATCCRAARRRSLWPG